MENVKNTETTLIQIKKTVEVLLLLELCKSGATRDEARAVLGGFSNELFAKVNAVVSKKK